MDLLKQQGDRALKRSRRALLIQPGAIGDCILTLPLAKFLLDRLDIGAVDMLGRSDYIGYFPGRTCIDTIRAIDSVAMHRFFYPSADFHLRDRDPLVDAFAGYSFIISFLGESGTDFEQNLIFTANCNQAVETVLIPLKPKSDTVHISDFYISQFLQNCPQISGQTASSKSETLIKTLKSDIQIGKEMLGRKGLNAESIIAVLCPGSGGKSKCWHLSNFIAAAGKLKSASVQPVFLLGPAEMERFTPQQLNEIGRTAPVFRDLSLTEVLQVISSADAFIGNDSGITHLAAAVGVDTTVLFGPTEPKIYQPLGPKVKVIEDKSGDFTTKPSPVVQQAVLQALMAGFAHKK
ncbi:MAG: glycosyltransferase family 9 protein [Phycisphaerae bacterium]